MRARGRVPGERNGGIVALLVALVLGLAPPRVVAVVGRPAVERIYAPVPAFWHAPRWWLGHPSSPGVRATGAYCIHEHEGAWNANTGNGYYGGMQFLLSTWRSVGGVTRPDLATPREQLYRAWLVYLRDGHSWREWGTAHVCGLR